MAGSSQTAKKAVWFQLLDEGGKPFQEFGADKVFVSPVADVVDFRKAVHTEYATNKLKDIAAAQLKVFKDEYAFEANQPMDEEDPITAELGAKKKSALLVRVPAAMESHYNDDEAGPPPKKRHFSPPWTRVSKFSSLEYKPTDPLVELSRTCLAGSGLPDQRKMVLYCRPLFREQFQFLQQHVLKMGCRGWILGPPGTGKSTTAFAFACSLPRDTWTVTWVNLSGIDEPTMVQFENGQKKVIKSAKHDLLLEMFDADETTRNHIVFLDGFVSTIQYHVELQMRCYSWSKNKEKHRRVVVVCSMSSRRKINLDRDIMNKIQEFRVYSWTLEEYLEATKYKNFISHVRHNLDAGSYTKLPGISPSVDDLIRSKYYYAGGSSRFMFSVKTEIVVETIDSAVCSVDDVLLYIKGVAGDRANNTVNRLFSLHLMKNTRVTGIVSQFASIWLARKFGPSVIESLASLAAHERNPSLDGWLLEMWFFAKLSKDGVFLHSQYGRMVEEWSTSGYEILDPARLPAFTDPTWLKPMKWNQGGYDAVHVDVSQNLVRFVQVTRSNIHSFKIEYFYDFIMMLQQSTSSFEIQVLDIVFVVANDQLKNFKISTVTGEGLLAHFPGWTKGKEKNKVRILGIEKWN